MLHADVLTVAKARKMSIQTFHGPASDFAKPLAAKLFFSPPFKNEKLKAGGGSGGSSRGVGGTVGHHNSESSPVRPYQDKFQRQTIK